jgi:NTP pyrophosphatase (non-canonical NTP hydrolase)
MEFKEYESIIEKTAIYPNRGNNIIYPTLGLVGESGEVAEKVKKLIRDEKGVVNEEFKANIKKELGDVLWYITALSLEIGFSLESIAEANISKLIKRRETNTLSGSGDHREEV